jgi:REP element-mobilizing transposase RayT
MDQKVIDEHERTENPEIGRYDQLKRNRFYSSTSEEGTRFNDIRYLGYEKHYGTGFDSLWADGYYCGSAGHVSQESVKRYIQEQEGKKVFDYDIYECPEELKGQLKIGDFTNG